MKRHRFNNNICAAVFLQPERLTEISRGLSGATPPDSVFIFQHPEGVQERFDMHIVFCDPAGVASGSLGHRGCRCAQPPANFLQASGLLVA